MLPQRRKSAEEIAKLRESMGIPGAAPAEPEAPPAAPEPAQAPAPAVGKSPEKKKATTQRRREPVAPPPADAEAMAMEAPVIEEPITPRLPKPVRSLRKSEQGIVERAPSDRAVIPVARVEGTPLPQRRHNERELMELRRVQSAPPDQSVFHLKQLAARWYWVVLAYLLPLLGMLCAFLAHWLPDVPAPEFPTIAMAEFSRAPWLGKLGFWLLAGFCTLGLLMAGWFAWKKPRSRHHASFIAIIGLLILVFGIIHQFTPDYGP